MSSRTQNSVINIFLNSRLLATLLLGFSSGLPLALTGSTLQAWFTDANVNLAVIGALTLIGVPYTIKFLWSPVLDFYQIPFLGMRKGWIMLMQLCVAAMLVVLANMHPDSQATTMAMIAVCVAILAATQDVAIDAYRTDVLKPQERGLGAACFVFTYRVAAITSSGFALIFADYYGWKLTYEMMAYLMIALMVLTSQAPAITHAAAADSSILQAIRTALQDLLRRKNIWILLAFVMLYKFGDALALSLMTNFLMHGLGFSKTEIGLAYKIVSFFGAVLGAFVGGAILTRRSVYFGLIVFGLMQSFSNLMFVIMALVGKNFSLMTTSLFIENFCSGLSTAAFLAFLMSMCNKKYTASQFAALSAVAALGRVYMGPVAAWMVASFGWTIFFTWTFFISFAGIFLLLVLKEKVMTYEQPIESTI